MTKQFVPLKEGRIAYQTYGKGQQTLIFFHGLMGSSWLSEEWIEAIEQASVCVIALERPGYGDSSLLPIECVADWTAVFAQVVENLSIQSAIAVGCSAGAVYAYATAFAFPGVITGVWVLDGVPAVFLDNVMRHYSSESQTAYKWFLTTPLTEIQDYYAVRLDAFFKQQFESAESYIIKTLEDVRAGNCIGMARESQLQIIPWGFDVSTIQQPITLWHSENDGMVPYNAAREMIYLLKNSTLVTAEDCSFSPENNSHSESISQGFIHLLQQLNPGKNSENQ